ncbi:ATP-binding protein [Catenulispora pinisilvae]|uniref:ATP-binding protein n=1 Tax=Catenulispora pinisilvae TaxID=2705253 RepID=UPI0018922BBD|nr:ATP-binding protein [Catenulispora pinisilvae]
MRNEVSGSQHSVVQAGHIDVVNIGAAPRTPVLPPPQLMVAAPRRFVDRDEEVAALDDAVFGTSAGDAGGVFVVDGTAGVGKTALALHWAHRVRDRFPDGQLYANLNGYAPGAVTDPARILRRFLRALGVDPAAVPADAEECAELYRSQMATRRTLVVLDNAADSDQVRPLLPGSGACPVLVTSRSSLRSLVVREGAWRVTVPRLPMEHSTALLEQVIGAFRPAGTPGQLNRMAKLCARLPLALQIAAERIARSLNQDIDDVVAELATESRLWELLSSDDDEGQAAHSVFAWSYRGMEPQSARVFRLLGSHPGADFSATAAAALCGIEVSAAKRQLAVLAGFHLIEEIGTDRFQLHDLLRDFASDLSRDEDDRPTIRDALARVTTWYAWSVKAASKAMFMDTLDLDLGNRPTGIAPLVFADPEGATVWFERERVNLVGAVLAAADAGLHSEAAVLGAVLMEPYAHHFAVEEWQEVNHRALVAARQAGDRRLEAVVLESIGKRHRALHQLKESETAQRQSLKIRTELGDLRGQARSHNAIGLVHWRREDMEAATNCFLRGAAIAEPAGAVAELLFCRANLGGAQAQLERFDDAVLVLADVLSPLRETGQRYVEQNALQDMGVALRGLGRLDQAAVVGERAVELARELGSNVSCAQALIELAVTYRLMNHPEQALECSLQAGTINRRLHDRHREATALKESGKAHQALGRHSDAVAFMDAAARLLSDLDASPAENAATPSCAPEVSGQDQ